MEFEIIRHIAANILGVDEGIITAGSSFCEDLGANSLDVFEIMTQAEIITGLDLNTSRIGSIYTVSDAVNCIIETQKEGSTLNAEN